MTDTTKLPDVWVEDWPHDPHKMLTITRTQVRNSVRYVPASRLDAMREALRAVVDAWEATGTNHKPHLRSPLYAAITHARAALAPRTQEGE